MASYYKEGSECKSCSTEACAVGKYKKSCTQTENAQCLDCSGKPANSEYSTAGQNDQPTTCGWQCSSNYYKDGAQCEPCSTDKCGPGKYRGQACTGTANSACIACSEALPANAAWTRGGDPFDQDNCVWQCNNGYNKVGNACQQQVPPAITVVEPTCGAAGCLSEANHATDEVIVKLQLSTAPTQDVTITATADSQLNLPAGSTYTIPAGTQEISINVKVVDDTTKEDPKHYGKVSFQASSSDTNYNGISISEIQLSIADNDCSTLSAPAQGSIVGVCNNKHGDTCTVKCNAGLLCVCCLACMHVAHAHLGRTCAFPVVVCNVVSTALLMLQCTHRIRTLWECRAYVQNRLDLE